MSTHISNMKRVQRQARESGGVRFWLLLAILVLIVLYIVSAGWGMRAMMEPVWVLMSGWVRFVRRTGSAIRWNWDLIGMSVGATVGILVLVQKLVGEIFNRVAVARGLSCRWCWKWTWSGFIGLLVLFLVGMAGAGIVHQVGWLLSANESLMEPKNLKWQDHANMKQLELEIRIMLEDSGGDLAKARLEPGGSLYQASTSRPSLQAYHVLLVQNPDEKIVGRLIFPRNGQQREKVGGYFFFDSGAGGLCSWPQLQEIIRTNRAHLVTF